MAKKNKKVNDFERSSMSYFKDIGNFTPLTQIEEFNLWKDYKYNHNMESRDKLIKSNLKFVVNIAKKYQGFGLSYSDLIAEGNMGLLKGIDKFDGNKGFRFITYSAFWIRQTIIEALNKRNGIDGDELPNEEEPTNNEEDIQSTSFEIPDEFIIGDEFNEIHVKEIENILNLLMNGISDKERRVINEYYGLSGYEPKTLDVIGKEMKLTKERIRQIMCSAFKKIRTAALELNINESIY